MLLVLLDDHAQWAAHCYGNSELRTPTLDYLADTGVKMENAFTPTPVCSPGRAALLTGRIASQHGIHDFLGGEYETRDGRPWLEDERTLAQILSDAGYVVGLSGKWHLGGSSEKQPGFDYWYQEAKYSPDRGHTALQRSALAWPHPWPGAPDSSRDPGVHTITDYAIDFLRTRDRQRPFFLIAGYIATHSPWIGHPERLVSAYRRCTFRDVPPDAMYPYGRPALESRFPSRQRPFEALAQYYAAVSVIDEQVGRLIDELDAQGCRSNTLVVYTSDHGLNMGHHGVWGKGNGTRPLNMLDESIRIPLIFNHPDTIFGGQVRNEMVTHCDTFQTILDHVPPPFAKPNEPFHMLVSNIDWNDYVGRVAVGKILGGEVKVGDNVWVLRNSGAKKTRCKITKVFEYSGLGTSESATGIAGNIVGISGFDDVDIGDTITANEADHPLPFTQIDP
ncbi:MAG: sulfatase-like hydrolase/transferase, partial [Actinomycetota bacterium]|nr:sulfatase-like hydrolase/transferase [Actinomycetota bacterium]